MFLTFSRLIPERGEAGFAGISGTEPDWPRGGVTKIA
jgi:hypothetical protein